MTLALPPGRPLRALVRSFALPLAVMLSLDTHATVAHAQEVPLSTGQTVYLPVYSHVYHGDLDRKGKPAETLVSTHVSIRNTDPGVPVRLLSARYHDTQGRLVRDYLKGPVTVPPLGTHELFVPRSDTAGGSGANFLIVWAADAPANLPIIEALHADIREARTLMLHTAGSPIRPR